MATVLDRISEIVKQIPPGGISDWDLAALNECSLAELRHWLKRFPQLESFERCVVKDHPSIKGKISTISETIWYLSGDESISLKTVYDFSGFLVI